MAGVIVIVVVVMCAVCAYAGHEIGMSKGRATEGLALGLFLGLIGVIIIYVLPVKESPTSHVGSAWWAGLGTS